MSEYVPVVTIDGSSGCGKGTIAQLVADKLGWYYLDSGALYRAMAWAVMHYELPLDNVTDLVARLAQVDIRLTSTPGNDFALSCDGTDVMYEIRTEKCGVMASKIASIPAVRGLLTVHQQAMRQHPGLVADGRDMGSVVFSDAKVKFFLEASVPVRAKRRFNQLKDKGIDASLPKIEEELQKRDQRDQTRAVSPAIASDDMILIDTSNLDINQVLSKVMSYIVQS